MQAPEAHDEFESPASPVRGILRHPATTAVLALLFVFVLGLVFHADGAFYKWSTHRDALRQASVFGILACGMTLVIITAGIDLSVGSVLGLVAVSFSLLSIHWGWSPWIAIPTCLLIGVAKDPPHATLRRFCRHRGIALAYRADTRGFAKAEGLGESDSSTSCSGDNSPSSGDVRHRSSFLYWMLFLQLS